MARPRWHVGAADRREDSASTPEPTSTADVAETRTRNSRITPPLNGTWALLGQVESVHAGRALSEAERLVQVVGRFPFRA